MRTIILDDNYVTCSQCGICIEELQGTSVEVRAPCPACGSTKRTISVSIVETVTLYKKTKIKHKRPDRKKSTIYEGISGEDLHRDSGQWNHLEREIDRENYRYREIIVNPKSREIIRNVDEPLTKHVDRGSAKPRIK